MTDKIQPTLINFKLPKVIDLSQPGAKITFDVEATDGVGGSGINQVNIAIDRFVSGGTLRKHISWSPERSSADAQIVSTDTFSDATPSTASGYFNVGPGTPTGAVQFEIWISDKAGNFKVYTAAELAALGFNSTVTLVNAAAPIAPTASLASAETDTVGTSRTFVGTSAAGTTVYVSALSNGNWVDIGHTVAGADGKWTLQSSELSDGIYSETSAWATDAAGNASAVSTPFSFDVWKDGLNAPTLTLPVHASNLLRVDNPVVTGTGVPQALVTLFMDGQAVGTGRVNQNGNWAILTDTLADGSHTFTASQSTVTGRTSPITQAVEATVAVEPDTGLKFIISSLTGATSGADKAFIQNMLDDTAARLSEVLDANQTVPVEVDIRDLGNAVASAGGWVGVDGNGTPLLKSASLNLHVSEPTLYAKSESVNAFLLAHEMLHALGFANGVTAFSKYVREQNDGIYFVGPNTTAVNGGALRLDSSGSHVEGRDDLMGSSGGLHDSDAFSAANPYAPFSMLNLAILKDIGWSTKPVLVSKDGHTYVAGSGKAGFDQVDGTVGLDTFFINQNHSSLDGKWVNGEYLLSSASSGTSHSLSGIERVQFADKMVALDIEGTGGQIYRLYQAVFGRTPDAPGLGFWIEGVDSGMTLSQAADLFVASNEFKTLYGFNPSAQEIITKLYGNVLHRAPDQGGLDYWVPIIQRDPTLVEEVLVAFSESSENKDQVAKIIGNGFEYEPYS